MAVIPDAKQPSIHLHNLKKSLVVILGLIAISVTAEADRFAEIVISLFTIHYSRVPLPLIATLLASDIIIVWS